MDISLSLWANLSLNGVLRNIAPVLHIISKNREKIEKKGWEACLKKKIVLRPIGIEEPDDLESHHKILRKSEPIGLLPKGIFQ